MEPYLLFLGAIFGSGGAGALGVKYMLNGSREAIRRIESKTDRIGENVVSLGERVATIEGKLSK